MKASTWRTSPLMARLSMPTDVEKHMDGEMQPIVLLCECMIRDITIIVCFS
jgi:hypothetical protein